MKTSHLIGVANAAKSPLSILKMLKAIVRGEYKPSFKTLLYFFLFVAYLIMPADILPDFIPFLGWVDDGMLLILLIGRLNTEADIFIKNSVVSAVQVTK